MGDKDPFCPKHRGVGSRPKGADLGVNEQKFKLFVLLTTRDKNCVRDFDPLGIYCL